MNKWNLCIFVLGITLAAIPGFQAHAAVLTFDDVPGGSLQDHYGNMPTYKGFNFTATLDWIDLDSQQWHFGAHSGDFGLLNNQNPPSIITEANGEDFTFDGLWAKKWRSPKNSGGPDSLFGSLSGYNNGSLVWSVDTSLNGNYEFYAAQLGAIDALHLDFGNRFLVDDIVLNGIAVSAALNVTATPIPPAVLLFGTALIGMFGFTRRKLAA